MRTEEEIRQDLNTISELYPDDKAIVDYGRIERLMASYFQGIKMGFWIALGELPTLSEANERGLEGLGFDPTSSQKETRP